MKLVTFTFFFSLLCLTTYAGQDKKTVKIRIQSQQGNLDEATLYFDQGIDPSYNFQQDAQKVFSGVAGVPVIYSLTNDNYLCSINGFGTLSNTEEVSLGVSVDRSGQYSITAALLDNFDPTSIITLEDRQVNRSIDLRTNFYPVYLDSGAAAEGRFYIHVSHPSSFSTTVAGCANNDATLSIASDTSVTWDKYELFDNLNHPMGDFNNVNMPVVFDSLSQGDYYLVRTKGAYQTTQNFHINGNMIQASIGATALQVETYENITFHANATNANHFEWDFGDGTWITGVAHPDLAYYEPGVYTVVLNCSNDHGCSTSATVQVIVTQSTATAIKEEVKQPAIIATGNIITVVLPGAVTTGDNIQVYNLLGQPVYNAPIIGEKSTVTFDEQPMGYYVVSVKSNNKVNNKRIFINR